MRQAVSLHLVVVTAIGLTTTTSAGLSCQQWNSETFFQTASLDDVFRCLDAGSDIHARDKEGNTPVYWAASNEDPAIVEALLAAGADPNARNVYGHNSLHAAASNENSAVARALLAAGANLHARSWRGDFPLHWAASYDNC